jgi:hypothetical protein
MFHELGWQSSGKPCTQDIRALLSEAIAIFLPGYGLDGPCSIPDRGKRFFSTPQLSLPVSYPMGAGDLSPGVKRQEREADYSPPSSADVKNGGAIPLLPPYFLMSLCLIK